MAYITRRVNKRDRIWDTGSRVTIASTAGSRIRCGPDTWILTSGGCYIQGRDPIINSVRPPSSDADPACEPHSENRGASLSMNWIRDHVRAATHRVGQRSVRDVGSGVDNVSPTGSVISDGLGTLIRHEFRADHRSGLELDGRVSRWINGHGMLESWSVVRICVVAEITCGPCIRCGGGSC